MIEAGDMKIQCLRVVWHYLYDTAFENITITDWISKHGLVKREINTGRVSFTDMNGNLMEYGSIVDSYTLTNVRLQN